MVMEIMGHKTALPKFRKNQAKILYLAFVLYSKKNSMNPISEAIQLKQQLDDLRPLSAADEQRIMQKFRLDWNYHSNNLEGNSLTYGETKALILFGITAQGKPLKDHFEVVGHNEAVEWILEVLKDERPLSENFIRELHQLILKEPYQVDAITPDGQPTKKWIKVGVYKTEPNHVKTKTGEIFRFASPEETPAKMQELIEWYRAESEKETVNAILLAATFHYRFIRIHPFDDGNGRTVRILMNFILMHFGFPPVIIKTEDKASYLSALAQADAGILEPFVNYIAENLVHSLEIMLKGARGESIEDPDDLDKQIALLEAQLNGDKIEKTKSEETLKEWFDTVLPVIVEQFVEVNEKFRRFYVTQDYQLLIKKDKAILDGYGEVFDIDYQYFEYGHFVKDNILKTYNNLY